MYLFKKPTKSPLTSRSAKFLSEMVDIMTANIKDPMLKSMMGQVNSLLKAVDASKNAQAAVEAALNHVKAHWPPEETTDGSTNPS